MVPFNRETTTSESNTNADIAEALRIISDYTSANGIQSYDVSEVFTTGKCIYGSVLINDESCFFKVGNVDQILKELDGFEIATIYPHEPIIATFFNDARGLILQSYSRDMVNGGNGLWSNYLNSMIFQTAEVNEEWMDKASKLFTTLYNILNQTITTPARADAPNDDFFYKRLLPEGRIDAFYKSRAFTFPSLQKMFLYDQFKHITLAAFGNEVSIDDLHMEAFLNLNPSVNRVFALTQGDLTENNITADGTFFDFETAGMNSIIQDLAIFTFFSFIFSHYFSVKYSNNPSTNSAYNTNDMVSIEASFSDDENKLSIQPAYHLPEIKRQFLYLFNEMVIKKLEYEGKLPQGKDVVKAFQSALFCRIMLVKNILQFEEKDMLMSLALLPYLCSETEDVTLSSFIENKFINWKNE